MTFHNDSATLILEMSKMTAPEIAQVQDNLSMLLATSVTAEILLHRQLADSTGESSSISLLDMAFEDRSSEHHRKIRQTALLLEQDDFDLPDFTLRPKLNSLVDGLLKMFGDMSIKFEDSPEFSAAYDVIGWVEPTVRAFFVKDIRDHFAKDHKWSVCGHGKRLVIFKRGKVIKEANHDEFIKEALPILALFQRGEEALDARPDLRRETRSEDITASSKRMGGVAGAMISNHMDAIKITRSQLEEFAGSKSPRPITNGMARQVIGQIGPAIVAAIVATLVAIVFGALCLILGQGYQRLLAIPCFLMSGVGIVGSYFLNRYRSSKTRVLQYGVLHEGTITDIERTQTKVNDQRRHLVTIENGKTKSICRAYGTAAKLANTMKESGESVRFLVDPQDETNVVCLDLLTLTEG